MYYLIGFLILYFIYTLAVKIYNNWLLEQQMKEDQTKKEEKEYYSKSLLTKSELTFYKKLEYFNNEYIVVPQVNLGAIVSKANSKYRSELFRNIDFGIFNKNFELLLLIELNDSTHSNINRKDRDLKVKKILSDCDIKLLTFYTKYPNEKEYVIKRINEALNSNETPTTLESNSKQ